MLARLQDKEQLYPVCKNPNESARPVRSCAYAFAGGLTSPKP